MIRAELNKLTIKNFGWLFVLIAFVLRVILLISEVYPINNVTSARQSEYLKRYSVFDGALNDAKITSIESAFTEIFEADNKLKELRLAFMNGEISEDAFLEQSKALEALNAERVLFREFHQQYTYASENPENRFLLYDNGWRALIERERIDWGAVLLTIIFATVLFTREYETDMRRILISTPNGNKKLVNAKILAILLVIVFITLISSITEVSYIGIHFTLPHGNFPLQSLSFFQNTDYQTSLWGAYLLIFLYRLLGLILIAAFTMIISVIGKSSILSLVSGVAVSFVPWVLPVKESYKYRIASPTSFLMAQGYLRGSDTSLSVNVPGMEEAFIGVSKQHQLLYVCVYLIVAIICIFICRHFFISTYARKMKPIQKPMLALMVIALLITTACTGSVRHPWQPGQEYNQIQNHNFAEYGGNIIVDYPYLASIDMIGAEVQLLIRDPFYRKNEINLNPFGFFQQGDFLFYLFYTQFEKQLIRLNLRTLESNIVWAEKVKNTDNRITEFYHPLKANELVNTSDFFISGDDLYLITLTSLEKVNLITGHKTSITEDYNRQSAFDGENLYYITSDNKLHHLSLLTMQEKVNDDLRIGTMYLNNGLIYFENLNYGSYIFSFDPISQELKPVTSDPSYYFIVEDNIIYYINTNDGFIYSKDLSENNEKLVYEKFSDTFTKLKDQPLLYVVSYGKDFTFEPAIFNLKTMTSIPVDFDKNK